MQLTEVQSDSIATPRSMTTASSSSLSPGDEVPKVSRRDRVDSQALDQVPLDEEVAGSHPDFQVGPRGVSRCRRMAEDGPVKGRFAGVVRPKGRGRE
jgi:hypothetical protein